MYIYKFIITCWWGRVIAYTELRRRPSVPIAGEELLKADSTAAADKRLNQT